MGWGDRVEAYTQFIKSSDTSLVSLWAEPDLIQVCPDCDRFLFPILGTGNRYWCSEYEVQTKGEPHNARLEQVARSETVFGHPTESDGDTPNSTEQHQP